MLQKVCWEKKENASYQKFPFQNFCMYGFSSGFPPSGFNSLPNNKKCRLTQLKSSAEDNLNVTHMMELVTSIFSFSHNVFKRLLSLDH